MFTRRSIAAAVFGLAILQPAAAAFADQVNVYSYRQPFLIEPLFKSFEKDTGIDVKVVFANKGLVERLKNEGRNSPADLVMTVDIQRLDALYKEGLTQPVMTQKLEAGIPAQYIGPKGNYFGLTTRARVIYASKDRVAPGEIQTYQDLADPKWAGRICTRSGTHPYQVALTAAMIAHDGEAATKSWLEGLKANLARKPQGNDRAQVKAISEGLCDLSLGNNYYYGNMLDDPEQKPWADSVNVIFPNQKTTGTHLNISGMALTKHAPNKENAVKLMEYLASEKAQMMYAQDNYEYPVTPGVAVSPLLESLGTFTSDDLSLAKIAELRDEAIKLTNEVGYNE